LAIIFPPVSEAHLKIAILDHRVNSAKPINCPATSGLSNCGVCLNAKAITQVFHILIFIISLLILNMTGFYPRKLISNEYMSL
jgi:hypothetical protein